MLIKSSNNPTYKAASDWQDEIQTAETFRDGYLVGAEELLAKYAGNDFHKDLVPGEQVENTLYEIAAATLPHLAWSAPQVNFGCRAHDPQRVELMNEAVNAWINQSGLIDRLHDAAVDYLFGPITMLITVGPVPGYEDDASLATLPPEIQAKGVGMLWPRITLLPSSRVLVDPYGTDSDSMGYIGHQWFDRVARVLRRPGIDPALAESLLDEQETSRSLQAQRGVDLPKGIPDRKMISGYEIYDAEDRAVYSIGSPRASAKVGYLRQPRPYRYGPKRGPYIFGGAFRVPGHVWPLSTFRVMACMDRELQAHLAKASNDAAAAKTLTVIDSENKELAHAIQYGEDGHIVRVPNYRRGQADTLTRGGVQKETFEYLQIMGQRFAKVSGVTDQMRSMAQGGTATETDVIARAANVRMEYLKRRFAALVLQAIDTAAQLIHDHPQVSFPSVLTDPMTGNRVGKMLKGGSYPGQNYRDLLPSIAPTSMHFEDSAIKQRRMMDAIGFMGQALPAMMANPALQVTEIVDDFFDTLNIPQASSRYINRDMLAMSRQMQMLSMAGAMGGGMAGGGGGMPAEMGSGVGANGGPTPGRPSNLMRGLNPPGTPDAGMGAGAGNTPRMPKSRGRSAAETASNPSLSQAQSRAQTARG